MENTAFTMEKGGWKIRPTSGEHAVEVGFADDGDFQFLGFVAFGAAAFAGEEVGGVLADGTGDFAPGGENFFGDVVAGGGEGPGDDEAFAGEGFVAAGGGFGGEGGVVVGPGIDAQLGESVEDVAPGFALEEIEGAVGDGGAHFGGDLVGGELGIVLLAVAGLEGAQFGEDGGLGDLAEVVMESGQFARGGLADLVDAHGEDPAGEGHLSGGSLAGLHDLGGVFLAEDAGGVVGAEIEGGEPGLGNFEQVEGGPDEASLDEFFRDDAADALDIERLAADELPHPAGDLGGALEVDAEVGDDAALFSLGAG